MAAAPWKSCLVLEQKNAQEVGFTSHRLWPVKSLYLSHNHFS
jgi:hypothetical protein